MSILSDGPSIRNVGPLALLLLAVPAARADPACSGRPSTTFSPGIDVTAPAGILGLQLLPGHDNLRLGSPGLGPASTVLVTPVDPQMPASAVVEIVDLNQQPCWVGVSILPMEPGSVGNEPICSLPDLNVIGGAIEGVSRLEISVSGLTSNTVGGFAECSVNLFPVAEDEPLLPPGYEHSCPTATIRMPLAGDLELEYDFEKPPPSDFNIWLLVSQMIDPLPVESPTFGPFVEITEAHEPSCSDILRAKGNCLSAPDPFLPQLKLTCGRFASDPVALCADVSLHERDDDGDGAPICDSFGQLVDCNDNNRSIHPFLVGPPCEPVCPDPPGDCIVCLPDDPGMCNGLDDDCDCFDGDPFCYIDDPNFNGMNDDDSDGFVDCLDCLPNLGDDEFWLIEDVADLLVIHDGGGLVTLTWSPADCIGTTGSIVYDTLSSTSAMDFQAALCVESNENDLTATDFRPVNPGEVVYYLVAPEHLVLPADFGCRTGGAGPDGAPREVRTCP